MAELLAGLAVGYVIGVIVAFVLSRSGGPLPPGRDNRDVRRGTRP